MTMRTSGHARRNRVNIINPAGKYVVVSASVARGRSQIMTILENINDLK